jgi:hypothetical protein
VVSKSILDVGRLVVWFSDLLGISCDKSGRRVKKPADAKKVDGQVVQAQVNISA